MSDRFSGNINFKPKSSLSHHLSTGLTPPSSDNISPSPSLNQNNLFTSPKPHPKTTCYQKFQKMPHCNISSGLARHIPSSSSRPLRHHSLSSSTTTVGPRRPYHLPLPSSPSPTPLRLPLSRWSSGNERVRRQRDTHTHTQTHSTSLLRVSFFVWTDQRGGVVQMITQRRQSLIRRTDNPSHSSSSSYKLWLWTGPTGGVCSCHLYHRELRFRRHF